MRYILIACLALAGGCALISPEMELRVSAFDGDGTYLDQAKGKVKGCRFSQVGEKIEGCMRVKTATCSYTSPGC